MTVFTSYGVQALLACSVIYVIYHIHWEMTVGASRRRLIKQHGCKPVKRLPLKDRLFGIDFLWNNWTNLKNHTALESTQQNFIALKSNTTALNLLGQRVIATIEPENIKSVLATDFKSFELPSGRKKLLVPLLGEGIFTNNGASWQHSRDMLRPNFVRSQLVEDLAMFERHVDHLIHAIPKDGSIVDLQQLFFQFTLDLGECSLHLSLVSLLEEPAHL